MVQPETFLFHFFCNSFSVQIEIYMILIYVLYDILDLILYITHNVS